jgi:hypothetical protein
MNSIWERLYDRIKDRRYGLLFLYAFLAAVACLLVLIIATQAFSLSPAQMAEAAGAILAVLLAGAIARCCVDTARGRGRRDDGSSCSRLSSDELRKARSKLMTNRDRSSV